ncbi:MAG: hypothetical protein ACD_4C00136G0021 [uncultured bacterium (gcode 4)]|uniref:Uncharacterized protein n=1 Tax=uncultured bacterium (gcode 4) TaxID=1234023 RepID=K2F6W6_9BACT|nr:MAG: hypothetical protein ACD_4C00136G0021 [uncultured bacterium (gcode 4)]
MEFLKKIENWKYEFVIDLDIFSMDIILKASYNFLDKGYFYFKKENSSVIVQFTKKAQIKNTSEKILNEFSDELLNVFLRDRIEKENKSIRENIVKKALIWLSWFQNEEKIWDIILNELKKDSKINIDDEEISKILSSIKDELWN